MKFEQKLLYKPCIFHFSSFQMAVQEIPVDLCKFIKLFDFIYLISEMLGCGSNPKSGHDRTNGEQSQIQTVEDAAK